MKCKSILVTGGAGFIGSNFIPHLLETQRDVKVVNLDLLTYAGDVNNLSEITDHPNYTFVEGDICDEELLDKLFGEHQIDGVIHFAAESHVDNSITGPKAFVQTNVVGTFALLETARRHWMDGPGKLKEGKKDVKFLHVSTDEVYGTLGKTGLFKETTPYAPNSPYSASKAASDHFVRSYYHTFQMPVVTTNCSNNFGPKQHDEKLIPTIIRKAINGEPIPIYGDGTNVRDWLYVLDHCKGILLAFNEGKLGETYNIGGRNERDNMYIAKRICAMLDEQLPLENKKYESLITFVTDRPGHDMRYAIDATKIEQELGWKADENFETGIEKTVRWYTQKYSEAK